MQRYATESKSSLHGSVCKGFIDMTAPVKAEIVPLFNYKNKKLLPSQKPLCTSRYTGRGSQVKNHYAGLFLLASR